MVETVNEKEVRARLEALKVDITNKFFGSDYELVNVRIQRNDNNPMFKGGALFGPVADSDSLSFTLDFKRVPKKDEGSEEIIKTLRAQVADLADDNADLKYKIDTIHRVLDGPDMEDD